MSFKSVLIIANPAAGRFDTVGTEWIDFLSEHYQELRAEVYVFHTHIPRDHDGIRRAQEKHSPDLILAVGGDGTLNDIISGLHHYNGVIGVIPAGSGNDAARMLWEANQLNQDEWNATPSSQTKMIDVWRCNDSFFICGCGIGFEGAVVQSIVNSKIRLPPKLKYWTSILANVLFYREIPFRVEIDHELVWTGKALMVSAANGTTVGGGIRISPHADPTDGQLNIHRVGKMNPLKRIINLPRIERGKHLHLKEVSSHSGRQIQITASQDVCGHLDGQLIKGRTFNIGFSHQIRFLCR
jgi:YegS/Rv2252/BmrU family lipid kinase